MIFGNEKLLHPISVELGVGTYLKMERKKKVPFPGRALNNMQAKWIKAAQ